MNFSALDAHDVIAWDFDGTLLGHPRSEAMHAYIASTPDKTHHIVTHRSHKMEKTMWDEMKFHYPNGPSRESFVEVINVPDDVYENFHLSQRSPGGLIMLDYNAYVNWKGEMCHSLGATILVDDNSDHVRPGCIKYAIAYIHPDYL
jgi:hypothetical protein